MLILFSFELCHPVNKRSQTLSLQVIRLQRANESLEKDLSATRSSFQALEKMHNAVKNTLEK